MTMARGMLSERLTYPAHCVESTVTVGGLLDISAVALADLANVLSEKYVSLER